MTMIKCSPLLLLSSRTIFLLVTLLIRRPSLVRCLKINHLWVPDAMPNGSTDSAILDCDYELRSEDRETLEVKWYFRYDPTPIYQWIPPNPPQVFGKFKEHLNLHYLASDDPWTEHRALHLQRVNTELSGRYSCRVSSIFKDDFKSKEMIVFAAPKSVDIVHRYQGEDEIKFTCKVDRAYPEPRVEMAIRQNRGNAVGNRSEFGRPSLKGPPAVPEEFIIGEDLQTRSVTWFRGSYSVQTSSVVRIGDLPPFYREAIVLRPTDLSIVCRVSLPGTSFSQDHQRVIQGRNFEFSDSNSAPRETGFSKPKTTIPFLLLTLHMAIFNPD